MPQNQKTWCLIRRQVRFFRNLGLIGAILTSIVAFPANAMAAGEEANANKPVHVTVKAMGASDEKNGKRLIRSDLTATQLANFLAVMALQDRFSVKDMSVRIERIIDGKTAIRVVHLGKMIKQGHGDKPVGLIEGDIIFAMWPDFV